MSKTIKYLSNKESLFSFPISGQLSAKFITNTDTNIVNPKVEQENLRKPVSCLSIFPNSIHLEKEKLVMSMIYISIAASNLLCLILRGV